MKFTILLFLLLLQVRGVFAQFVGEQHMDVELQSYGSTKGNLPFWLWANQKGRIMEAGKFQQVGIVRFEGSVADTTRKVKIGYGVSLVASTASTGSATETNRTQINEAFVTIAYKKILFKIGEQCAESRLGGLSSSNGDFYYSNNSRPYPSVRIGTNGFVRLFKNVSLSAVYEEALIRDPYEYMENPNLHHKNLNIRWGQPEKLRITGGLEDYAWWGGTSPEPRFGKQPSGLDDYIKVILFQPGGDNAVWQERENTIGNHLGQYKLTIEKDIDNQSFRFYMCHPIEDFSGIKWQNWQDNMVELYWKKKEGRSLISSALIEYYFTRNQNIHPTNSATFPVGQTPVDYFNHGIYRSGNTYKGFVIGSPLFYPLVYNAEGKVFRIANTRFYAFHGGIGGSFVPRDSYKLLLTYSMNSGSWIYPYARRQQRISSLFEYTYNWKKNLEVNGGVGYDYTYQWGEMKNVVGGYVGISWKLIQ